MKLIPVTILTGFLGAGKTSLLNRILKEDHGHKIAVIENEFGQENIDNEILVQDSSEQIIEMNNGCICCTVRGDLIVALNHLSSQLRDGTLHFDRVVIETTGLANPGPVAQTFFVDAEVGAHFMLDAIVTVVDAHHAMTQLDDYEEAQRQVGFADKILVSKIDLVNEEQLNLLKQRLIQMNPRAPIVPCDFGKIAIDEIFDIKGFNLNAHLILDPQFLKQDQSKHDEHHDHAHCDESCDRHDHEHHHHHSHHTDDIAAFVFKSSRPFNTERLDYFLGGLVQEFGPIMLRYKGVLYMEHADRKVIFQGVHQIMGTDVGVKWADDEEKESKLVFIGKNLPKALFIEGLSQCLV
jgi:G3E family GTPase